MALIGRAHTYWLRREKLEFWRNNWIIFKSLCYITSWYDFTIIVLKICSFFHRWDITTSVTFWTINWPWENIVLSQHGNFVNLANSNAIYFYTTGNRWHGNAFILFVANLNFLILWHGSSTRNFICISLVNFLLLSFLEDSLSQLFWAHCVKGGRRKSPRLFEIIAVVSDLFGNI